MSNLCPDCGNPKEMYGVLWCPKCEKPQKESMEYLNLIKCLKHIEALGHEGYYKRMWDKVLFTHIVDGGGNDSCFHFSIEEEYADPEQWPDIKLLRDTFDLGDGAMFFVSW